RLAVELLDLSRQLNRAPRSRRTTSSREKIPCDREFRPKTSKLTSKSRCSSRVSTRILCAGEQGIFHAQQGISREFLSLGREFIHAGRKRRSRTPYERTERGRRPRLQQQMTSAKFF